MFSGGASLGAVQIGMLRALYEHDIHPDVIVGCSVGAINGATYAMEPGIRGLNRLSNIWGRLADRQPDLMPNRLFPLAVQMGLRSEGLHDPDVLRQLLDDELWADDIGDLEVPFACVATSLTKADEHWFDEGPLIPALMASAALPAVYPPVEIEGELFMDGGVVREAPVDQAAAMGANKIYLLHVGHLAEIREPDLERPLDGLLHAYWVARHRRFEEDLEELGKRCELIRLPAGDIPRVRFDDFSRSRELSRLAYEASAAFLSAGSLSS
ncbi:MAG: NTE family protein [Acidimicrobiales bacterium]